ncbi:hypothetical protein K456DRAFT_1566670 [Colletotrichum gloeosporioides 23]|nr:hypothetical protein K456DRAFT_1566670 [Colletotrichum gloeosporioides 23]
MNKQTTNRREGFNEGYGKRKLGRAGSASVSVHRSRSWLAGLGGEERAGENRSEQNQGCSKMTGTTQVAGISGSSNRTLVARISAVR